MEVKLTETKLPWSGAPVRTTGDISRDLYEQQAPEVRDYLPRSITVYADPEIDQQEVRHFISGMSHHFARELAIRKSRRDRFVELNLFTDAEIDSFLISRRDFQPWVLYYSRN